MRVRTTPLTMALLALTTSATAQNNQQAVNQFGGENVDAQMNAFIENAENAGNANLGNGNLGNLGNSNAENEAQSQNANGANAAQGNFGNNGTQGNFGNNEAQGNFDNNAGQANGANSNIPANNLNAPVNNIPFNTPLNFNDGGNNTGQPINAAPTNPAFGNPALGNQAQSNVAAPVNSAATESAAAAPLTPAPPAEMRFQFDQKGTPSMHSFILKWADGNANLTSITVLVSDTQEVLQTIPIPQDGSVKLIHSELTEKPGRIKDKFFDFIDYNFDSFGDIRLTKQWPYKPGKKSYLVWLFNENANSYILHAEISALPSTFVDTKAKRIESFTIGAWGGGEYEKRWYSLTSKGKLKLQTEVKQTIRDRGRLVFNRDVRQRIQGEMQRICRLVVPTEGKVQRLWGKASNCAYFMEKHPIHH